MLGEYEAAASELHKGLDLASQVGDRTIETNMLLGLSLTYNLYHRGEEALAYTERALAIAHELNDPRLRAAGLASRLMARSAGYGQIAEATPDAEEALRLSRELGDPSLSAQTLIFCGQMFEFRADLDRAVAQLRQGLDLAQRTHQGFFVGYAAFCLGHTYLAKGEYEEALRWYQQMSDYASAAGDKFWMARAPNIIGGVHLELYDLDEAIGLNLEGDEVSQKLIPWPEPRGHSLLKVGLAHLARGDHGLAAEFFRRAWDLLEQDVWYRWRWHIPLLRARGELALAERRHDDAWSYAVQSLQMAKQSDSRKHVARAQRLQGEILAARGELEPAAEALRASISLAATIDTPREVWLGKAALAGVLARAGHDAQAEVTYAEAAQVIEAIAWGLTIPGLRRSLLGAEPVLAVYRALGRRPPVV
jgi:tetratricopeptide (TPR) repeat protein